MEASSLGLHVKDEFRNIVSEYVVNKIGTTFTSIFYKRRSLDAISDLQKLWEKKVGTVRAVQQEIIAKHPTKQQFTDFKCIKFLMIKLFQEYVGLHNPSVT